MISHQQFKESLYLQAFGELNTEERAVLERHVQTCKECRTDLVDLEKLHTLVEKRILVEPSDELLQQARQELRVALRLEHSKQSFWSALLEKISILELPQAQVALGSLAMMAIGLFIGYVFFRPSGEHERSTKQPFTQSQASLQGETRISNMRFLDPDPKSGQVEFSFDAVTPVRMKGSINNPDVQKILAQALVDERNPGVRLQTVNAFATEVGVEKLPGDEIKDALIVTLETDGNPGVRKQALQVLQKMPRDEKIQDALLYVLKNDDNDGLRIEAIKSLEKSIVTSQKVDQKVLNALRERIQSDENNYIRLRARNVLEEVKQQ